jgi:hypothetical protein
LLQQTESNIHAGISSAAALLNSSRTHRRNEPLFRGASH